jgi:hypothetical protein
MLAVIVTGTKWSSVSARQYQCQIHGKVLVNAHTASAVCDMVYVPVPIPSPLNPLNAELNPICHLLALSGTHPIIHVSRIRVNFFLVLASV